MILRGTSVSPSTRDTLPAGSPGDGGFILPCLSDPSLAGNPRPMPEPARPHWHENPRAGGPGSTGGSPLPLAPDSIHRLFPQHPPPVPAAQRVTTRAMTRKPTERPPLPRTGCPDAVPGPHRTANHLLHHHFNAHGPPSLLPSSPWSDFSSDHDGGRNSPLKFLSPSLRRPRHTGPAGRASPRWALSWTAPANFPAWLRPCRARRATVPRVFKSF